MSYEIFEALCRQNGVKPYTVSKATGIDSATFSAWKKGEYTPKTDKRKKIAEFFNVSLEYLDRGEGADGLTARERIVLSLMRRLNHAGQERMIDYARVLVASDLFIEEDEE